MKPWLNIDEGHEPQGAVEAGLARDPQVREAIGNELGDWIIRVERLAASDLYLVWTTQGTLHCQHLAFVRAGRGGKPQIVDGPRAPPGDDNDLCWTRGGDFGTAFGTPVYAEHGANAQTTDDEDIKIMSWGKGRWSEACTLKLRYRPKFELTDRRCADEAVCALADASVLAITEAYDRHVQSDAKTPFRYPTAEASPGGRAEADWIAARKRKPFDPPPWPGFGDKPDERPVSDADAAYFTLVLGGRSFVASISHEGLAWRSNNTALLILYAQKNGAFTPQAAYAIDRSVGSLRGVTASR